MEVGHSEQKAAEHERGDHAWNIQGEVSRLTGQGLSPQVGKGQLRRPSQEGD